LFGGDRRYPVFYSSARDMAEMDLKGSPLETVEMLEAQCVRL